MRRNSDTQLNWFERLREENPFLLAITISVSVWLAILLLLLLTHGASLRVGRPHKVTLYSGGVAIKEYTTAGSVSLTKSSATFLDAKTRNRVTITGDYTVE